MSEKKKITFRNPLTGQFCRGTLERGKVFGGTVYIFAVNHVTLEDGTVFDCSDEELSLYQIVECKEDGQEEKAQAAGTAQAQGREAQ